MPDDDAAHLDAQPQDEPATEPAPEPEVLAAADGPGAWTALAAPGKPDGEVDTRG